MVVSALNKTPGITELFIKVVNDLDSLNPLNINIEQEIPRLNSSGREIIFAKFKFIFKTCIINTVNRNEDKSGIKHNIT